MTEAVFDFADIAARVARPNQEPVKSQSMHDAAHQRPVLVGAEAAINTLVAMGYTYLEGAEMWKPPLGPVGPISCGGLQCVNVPCQTVTWSSHHDFTSWIPDPTAGSYTVAED